jgi:hypothetical protein
MGINKHRWEVRRLTDRDIASIRLAKRRGMSGVEIAAELGIPKSTVYRILGSAPRSPKTHGVNMYWNDGCRCETCRAAIAGYARAHRAKLRASTTGVVAT